MAVGQHAIRAGKSIPVLTWTRWLLGFLSAQSDYIKKIKPPPPIESRINA